MISSTSETVKDHWIEIRQQLHPNCFVCCSQNERGLQLECERSSDGSMVGQFPCDRTLEGHSGLLHGGVISAVLDEAMANCLLAHGHVAVTADFRVRFRHPVVTGQVATVRAWISRARPPIYELSAEMIQNGQVKTVATGKFMDQN